MRHILVGAGVTFLILAVAAQAQPPVAKPAPELKEWDLWVGDWTMVGRAKDTPAGPGYKLNWHISGRWVLGGFAVQVDHTWKGDGPEVRSLEILHWDSSRKIHAFYGFGSDGGTWAATATFEKGRSLESMRMTSADGETATCRTTWIIGIDRMTISGTCECEQNGARWTNFAVQGVKAKTAARAR